MARLYRRSSAAGGDKAGETAPLPCHPASEFSEAGLESTVVLPLTTKLTPEDAFPLRVRIPRETCGLASDSDILVDQILAWDNSLFRKESGLLPEALVDNVKAALKDFLDI